MSLCPICSTEIVESFGLIECPQCHSLLFVDFDGSLKVQGASLETPEAPLEPAVSFAGELSEEKPETSEKFEEPEMSWDIPVDADVQTVDIQEEEKVEFQDETLQEIQEFAKSSESQMREGDLVYELKITEIDTQDLQNEILDILKDKKLNIDISALQIKDSRLQIPHLNSVKAAILVSRLKALPIQIEWEQTSLTQGADEGKQI